MIRGARRKVERKAGRGEEEKEVKVERKILQLTGIPPPSKLLGKLLSVSWKSLLSFL